MSPDPDEGHVEHREEGAASLAKSVLALSFSRHPALLATSRRDRDRGTAPCPPLAECPTLATNEAVEYEIGFRASVPIEHLRVRELPTLACVTISEDHAAVRVDADLLIAQRWRLRRLVRGDVASLISLAPSEAARVRTTQSIRKSFTRNTLDQSTQVTSFDSQVIDKDVLEVTRASSKTQNWGVDARATIPIKGVELSAGANFSEQLQRTASSVLTDLNETTRRSSQQVSTLNKIEVSTTSEQTDTQESGRLIANPYRDRTLDLFAFEVAKEYDVTECVERVCAAITVMVESLEFDERFVRANVGFLTEELLDSDLALQLSSSLSEGVDLSFTPTLVRASKAARLALRYLFDEPNMFNVKDLGGVDANNPDTSFDAQMPLSALQDAKDTKVALFFTTLNFYWKVYQDQQAAFSDQEIVDFVLSLHKAIGARWLQLLDAPAEAAVGDAVDDNNFTEALRRLSGFAALVAGVVDKVGTPSPEETKAYESRRRSEIAIQRVLEHLACFEEYYVERFLWYLHQTSRGTTTVSFARQLVSTLATNGVNVDGMAVRNAYVDGREIRIPSNDCHAPDEFLDAVGEGGGHVPASEWERSQTIRVTSDGLHLESRSGTCILREVPDAARDVRVMHSELS